MPIPPQKSKSSVDLFSLNFDSSAGATVPVLSPPLITSTSSVTSLSRPVTLSNTQSLITSTASPTRSLPRTNPYFQPPKSPKTEFGPFVGSSNPPVSAGHGQPPPIPSNTPSRPYQSVLNLSVIPEQSRPLPPRPRSPPPRPPALSKSLSHHSLPVIINNNKHKTSFNPFLSSSSVVPPVIKTWTNPFKAPLSSFPPEDPSDKSRLLGIQMFTELLASSNNETNNRNTNSSVCVDTNHVSDPLTNPPPSSTLPPMNRKPSTGLSAPIGQNSADNNQSQAPVSSKSSGDKYSALAELDDLFRSTTVDSPAPAPQTHDHSAVSTGLFSSSTKPVPNMFVLESPAAGGVGSPAGAWAPGRVSPAAAWSTSSAGRAASPGGWGSNTGNTSPMWTPHFGGDNTGGGPGLIPPQSTNPFGTSPSNPPPMMGTMFPTGDK